MHRLAIVYTNTSATVKRILLKLLDQPVSSTIIYNNVYYYYYYYYYYYQVRVVGMHSPELLELVEKCPQGAETLIMRMLYILTENGELLIV